MTVFLLWEDRAEHGENPVLVDVFATYEAAEAYRRALVEDEDFEDVYEIEERTPRG